MAQEWLKGPDLEVEGWEVSVEGEWRGWRERQKHSRKDKRLHEGSESGSGRHVWGRMKKRVRVSNWRHWEREAVTRYLSWDWS